MPILRSNYYLARYKFVRMPNSSYKNDAKRKVHSVLLLNKRKSRGGLVQTTKEYEETPSKDNWKLALSR